MLGIVLCCAVVLEWLVAVLRYSRIIAPSESGKWGSVVQVSELGRFWVGSIIYYYLLLAFRKWPSC